MLRELRERMQQLMEGAAAQRNCSSSEAQEAAAAKAQAACEGLRKELQSLKANRQTVWVSRIPLLPQLPSTSVGMLSHSICLAQHVSDLRNALKRSIG